MKTIEQLQTEQQERKDTQPVHIRNSDLYAGSPMTYYCRECGHVAEVLPESHTSIPKSLCDECAQLQVRLDRAHGLAQIAALSEEAVGGYE